MLAKLGSRACRTCTPNLTATGDDFDALAFQQGLLATAREINDKEFARWEAIARINTPSHPAITPDSQPMLEAWRPATRDPRHLELVYRGLEGEIASLDEQRAAHRDIQTLQLPPGLTDEQIRTWASACLLAAPFTNNVIRLENIEASSAARSLADIYSLSVTQARRDMETVQAWLAILIADERN